MGWCPKKRRQSVRHVKPVRRHTEYACEQWDERAQGGHESAEHHTLASVALKERLAAQRNLRIAAERQSFQDRAPIVASKPIRKRIAENRANCRPTDQWPERNRTSRRQRTDRDNDHGPRNDGADCRNSLEY